MTSTNSAAKPAAQTTTASVAAKQPIWTPEKVIKSIEADPTVLRRAVLAIHGAKERGIRFDVADRAYMTWLAVWLLADDKRVPEGEHHGRALSVMRHYAPVLATLRATSHLHLVTEETTATEEAPAAPMPVKIGATVTGSKGELYFVTHGSYYGQPWSAGWSCTCQDFFYRHRASKGETCCKHVKQIKANWAPFVFNPNG
jgi:hypothetical protein